jgi:hypothetical protein
VKTADHYVVSFPTVMLVVVPGFMLASPVNVIFLLAWSTVAGQDGLAVTVVMSGVLHVHCMGNERWFVTCHFDHGESRNPKIANLPRLGRL